jgi:thiamine-phosphate pyrophosphorylase
MPSSPNHHPARILDANANRAREALRVLEDAGRFLLDDAHATQDLKSLRHELVATLDLLPEGLLLASRAIEDDQGRSISTPTENVRSDACAVAEAAAARLSEALRSLEEWSKTIDPSLATRIESIRYRAYETSGALLVGLARPSPHWRLAVLVTRDDCCLSWREVIEGAIEGGADCIQVREKDMPDADLLQIVEEAISLARPHNVAVIVNDRVDIALITGADGVHLGSGDLPLEAVRSLSAGRLLIGCSVHDLDEAGAAIEGGCDYCGVGTMFATSTKPELVAVGPGFLATFIERHPDVPHLAIGGIDADHAVELARLGCRGVAVSTAICGADDPATATRAIIRALGVAESPIESVTQ